MSKVISRIVIEPSAEVKALLDDFKQTASDVITAIAKANNPYQPTGGLLDAMQDAANDSLSDAVQAAPKSHQGLEEWRAHNAKYKLGQWIFEGQDAKWISASVDRYGMPALHTVRRSELENDCANWFSDGESLTFLQPTLNADNWTDSPIDREPVNDVDYLSDTQQSDEIALDDQRNRLLAQSVPHVTPKDLQGIFVGGLADLLIQRMHSQDRFSEDDYGIGGADLMPWDVVVGCNSFNGGGSEFAVIICLSKIEHSDQSNFGVADLKSCFALNQFTHTGRYVKIRPSHNNTYRTITQDEIAAFKKALEACYV